MDENIIVVTHVETEVDANCAVAALADGGINAVKQYKNAPGGSTLFALPSAIGFGACEGYDIIVAKAAEKEARDILIGAGFAEPIDEDDEQEEASAESENNEAEETAENAEIPAEETPAPKGSGLLVILFLVAAGLFVIAADRLIELIKSLF